MPNRNIHEVMGHLGGDPELKYTQTGEPVCFMRVATSNDYRQGGEWVKRDPEWHSIVIFGKLGELVAGEFKKGDAIMVRGKHRTRVGEWNGQARQVSEIIASEVYRPIYVKKEKETEEEQASVPF